MSEHMWIYAPEEIDAVLHEVYEALNAGHFRLAVMGARAVLDIMIVDKVTDVGRFDQKLDALVKNDFITKKQREFLDAALDAGNAASHRGHCPKLGDLKRVLDIVESLLNQIYVLPDFGQEVRKNTPQRKRAAKK